MSTIFTITLPTELADALTAKAIQTGMTIEGYILDLIKRDLKRPTIDEILAPFRHEVATSGISDEDLDALFLRARCDYARENKG